MTIQPFQFNFGVEQLKRNKQLAQKMESDARLHLGQITNLQKERAAQLSIALDQVSQHQEKISEMITPGSCLMNESGRLKKRIQLLESKAKVIRDNVYDTEDHLPLTKAVRRDWMQLNHMILIAKVQYESVRKLEDQFCNEYSQCTTSLDAARNQVEQISKDLLKIQQSVNKERQKVDQRVWNRQKASRLLNHFLKAQTKSQELGSRQEWRRTSVPSSDSGKTASFAKKRFFQSNFR